jgi:hypothetical protein
LQRRENLAPVGGRQLRDALRAELLPDPSVELFLGLAESAARRANLVFHGRVLARGGRSAVGEVFNVLREEL